MDYVSDLLAVLNLSAKKIFSAITENSHNRSHLKDLKSSFTFAGNNVQTIPLAKNAVAARIINSQNRSL